MIGIKKTSYALFAIVPLLLAGITGSVSATTIETYEPKDVEDALLALQPYMVVGDDKITKLDVKAAKKAGIDKDQIKIVKKFIKYQNQLIAKLSSTETSRDVSSVEFEAPEFDRFFKKIVKQGFTQNQITTSGWCNWWGPHPQPSTNYVGSYTSAQAAINALPSSYDEVEDYAAAFTHDYHDWISAYSCADGIFRYQTTKKY